MIEMANIKPTASQALVLSGINVLEMARKVFEMTRVWTESNDRLNFSDFRIMPSNMIYFEPYLGRCFPKSDHVDRA